MGGFALGSLAGSLCFSLGSLRLAGGFLLEVCGVTRDGGGVVLWVGELELIHLLEEVSGLSEAAGALCGGQGAIVEEE